MLHIIYSEKQFFSLSSLMWIIGSIQTLLSHIRWIWLCQMVCALSGEYSTLKKIMQPAYNLMNLFLLNEKYFYWKVFDK